MEEHKTKERPWYKKKRYLFPIIAFFLLGLFSSGSTPQTNTLPVSVPQTVQTAPVLKTTVSPNKQVSEVEKPSLPKVQQVPSFNEPTLSNDNYYTNTYGNSVHSPAYADSVPSGASAQCRDGTYSFSQSRRGTCSHHGGVAEWL